LRVDGLEGIRRLPESRIEVTAAMLTEAQSYFTLAEATRQASAAPRELTIALRKDAPAEDGNL
jgi:hypothetical protein